MCKKDLMIKFLNKIKFKGLLTKFIQELYEIPEIHDYNYLYRLINEDNLVIIDIYDNITKNRFNRYIFSFDEGDYDYKVTEENNVFVTRIYVNNMTISDNHIYQFAYLFKLDSKDIIGEAEKIFSSEIINVLKSIINKPNK